MSASSKPSSFSVASSTGSYDVIVAQGIFTETLNRVEEAHILADEFFRTAFETSPATPIFIEATEQAKSLDRTPQLIEHLRASGANRSTHLVAIGGGVLQDISAFIASVYMRGLSWSYDPTTVLAMVDSCIGGKSSINVGPYKNLIGTFHPPKVILLDPNHAKTLPRDQFASGLIEAAKICYCRGPEPFSAYLDHAPSIAMSIDALEGVILESLHAKKWFIEIDEFDKKERLLLNFGHTFGHAIEGASQYAIPHGIAVGLGILCALNFQRQRGIDFTTAPRVAQLEAHLHQMVHALPNLREHLQTLSLDEVLERIGSDKKHTTTHYTLILVAPAGEVILERIPKSAATDTQLQQSIHTMIQSIERAVA